MASYAHLLSIVVTHEYLAGTPMNLRFVPSPDCAALMLREGLLLRATPEGAAVWREQPDSPANRPAGELFPLVFAVFTNDPQLQYCTAWPVAPPLRFVSADAGEQLQPQSLAGSGAARQPLFSVEIEHRTAPAGTA